VQAPARDAGRIQRERARLDRTQIDGTGAVGDLREFQRAFAVTYGGIEVEGALSPCMLGCRRVFDLAKRPLPRARALRDCLLVLGRADLDLCDAAPITLCRRAASAGYVRGTFRWRS